MNDRIYPRQRLEETLAAAKDYKQALEEIISQVGAILELDPNSALLQALSALTAERLLKHPTTSPAVIEREDTRIRLTRSEHARRKRHQHTIPTPQLTIAQEEARDAWRRERDPSFTLEFDPSNFADAKGREGTK